MTQYLVLLPSRGAPLRRPATDAGAAGPRQAAHGEFVQLLAERGHKLPRRRPAAPSQPDPRRPRLAAVDDVTVTEGPFAESAEQVGGYYVVETDDLDDLAQVCGRLIATPFHHGRRDPPARRRQ